MPLLWTAFLVLWVNVATQAADIPPSCESRIFCQGSLLHQVQTKQLYEDSKHFVDLRLLYDENVILDKFNQLMNETNDDPNVDKLREFVNANFADGNELEQWTPHDFSPEPDFLQTIKDSSFKQFAKDVIAIWPTLGRKVKDEVFDNPDLFSLIPLPNGFIIPGGRFKEIYYWDSYWIVEGLIISGMKDTARGMIENLLHLVKLLGHIPNGSRIYYNQRSQVPLLTQMVSLYVAATNDLNWLADQIDILEYEIQYWLDKQAVNVKIGRFEYTLLRYFAQSSGPRPESYREDYNNAQLFNTDERKQEFYTDIKSAAESGWDFSSRWFESNIDKNEANLTHIRTTRVVPVDLNSVFAGVLSTLGDFRARLGDRRSATKWWVLAKYWRNSINRVLWNKEDGIWYDYDIVTNSHRKRFYPSNVAPLWANAVEKPLVKYYAPRVVEYLKQSMALKFEGGVPTSLVNTGEQWDLPNAWPPLQSIIIGALYSSGNAEAEKIAVHLAEIWVRSNYLAFNRTKNMYEKYSAVSPGENGGGGEYNVQTGFGWSNGVVIELLNKFGALITSHD